MIIDNKNATENTIYNAYGYTVNAIEAIYRWTYDNSNREQKCYTMVSVLDSKNVEIFRYNGFNNPTFDDIFEKNIDCFLWWIKTDKPDIYDIEKTFYNAIIKNSCLFSYRIDQRKRKEAKLAAEHEKIAEREKLENEIKTYCKDNGLNLYKTYSNYYIVSFQDEKIKESFNHATVDRLKCYIDFINAHPENKQAKIIYEATTYNNDLNVILAEIKAL